MTDLHLFSSMYILLHYCVAKHKLIYLEEASPEVSSSTHTSYILIYPSSEAVTSSWESGENVRDLIGMA